VTLTAIAIKISPYFVIFTYGIMYGLGKGMAYVMPLSCGMKVSYELWSSNGLGLVHFFSVILYLFEENTDHKTCPPVS
jgi:hypothetical protein